MPESIDQDDAQKSGVSDAAMKPPPEQAKKIDTADESASSLQVKSVVDLRNLKPSDIPKLNPKDATCIVDLSADDGLKQDPPNSIPVSGPAASGVHVVTPSKPVFKEGAAAKRNLAATSFQDQASEGTRQKSTKRRTGLKASLPNVHDLNLSSQSLIDQAFHQVRGVDAQKPLTTKDTLFEIFNSFTVTNLSEFLKDKTQQNWPAGNKSVGVNRIVSFMLKELQDFNSLKMKSQEG